MTPFTARHFRKFLNRFTPQRWLNLHAIDERHQTWRIEDAPAGLESLPVYDIAAFLARIPARLTFPDGREFSRIETQPRGEYASFFRRINEQGEFEFFPRNGEESTLSRSRDDALAKLLLELFSSKLVNP